VAAASIVKSTVPPRLDRLPWSRWHVRLVLALGITWILDGLEASLIANLGPTLQDPRTLGLDPEHVGQANSVYLIGQVVGALFFGWLTDRLGRKKLFLVTLGLYLAATALSGAALGFAMFAALRFFAGAGLGGEYAAINSAIDELIPARVRGHVDLGINGSYWVGVALGAGLTLVFTNPHYLPVHLGWRLAFGLGALLGLGILFARRHLTESPRWLLIRGRAAEADAITTQIEHAVHGAEAVPPPPPPVEVKTYAAPGIAHLLHVLFVRFRRRSILALALMIAQAFFYNAVFFSYGMILTKFHRVAPHHVGLYMVPFAIGNFLGPVLLGGHFDRGRKKMICLCYAASGLLLLATGALFYMGVLTALTQTLAWCVVFFFASAAASSAYLTVSELYPVEVRAMAIAVFYALATSVGAIAPTLFGRLVQSGSAGALFVGYAVASGLMLVAAVVAAWLAVDSEGRSLESLSG
jgi:MFS family permease